MNKSLLIALSILGVAIIVDAEPLARQKRSLVQLQQVMKCATQLPGGAYDIFSTYNCYGCWCGKGGGGEPVDEIDRCCKDHDQCYDELNDSKTCNIWFGQVYWLGYDFECKEGDADLPTATGDTTRFAPVCTAASTECGMGACRCDVAFGNCIRRHKMAEKKVCPDERFVCIADSWHFFGSDQASRR